MKKQNPDTLEKINAIYILVLAIYMMYFLSTPFTWAKAIILTLAFIIALALLIIEFINYNK